MPVTYATIASSVLSSTVSTFTFSSIPGTYTDLVLIITGKDTTALNGFNVRFNGDTATNYSRLLMAGNGSAGVSSLVANDDALGLGLAGTTTSSNIINIFNYANTTVRKSVLSRTNSVTSNLTRAIVGAWRNTAAITSITITASTANYAAGTTLSLYGIKAA
jgi:hypothetical protein